MEVQDPFIITGVRIDRALDEKRGYELMVEVCDTSIDAEASFAFTIEIVQLHKPEYKRQEKVAPTDIERLLERLLLKAVVQRLEDDARP